MIAHRCRHFHRLQEVNSNPRGAEQSMPSSAKGTAFSGLAGIGSATVAPPRDDGDTICPKSIAARSDRASLPQLTFEL